MPETGEGASQMGLDSVLSSKGFEEVTAMDLYGSIFHLGEGLIQCRDEKAGLFKANPVIYMKDDDKSKGQYRILFEDEFQEVLEESYGFDFAITNGLSYFGRKMTIEKASKMYAMWVDIDGITEESLNLFANISGAEFGTCFYPQPNYFILSGHNIHLVYQFQEPIDLYPNIKIQLKNFKYGLIRRLWNGDLSNIKTPQYQGINQGFRPIGGKTKIKGVRVRAFKTKIPLWTIEELNKFLAEEYQVNLDMRYQQTKINFEEAKKLYPEWVAALNEEKPRGYWHVSRNLYQWFKRQIPIYAEFHHRYFCLMSLAMFGAKCSFYDEKKNPNPVTFEEVETDCALLQPYLTNLHPEDPITDADIESALECFDRSHVLFPRETIEKLTAVPMPETKRNGRTQIEHMKRVSLLRDFDYPDGIWRNTKGAPTKQEQILEYAKNHPEKNHSEIARDLGMSRTTVIKWLKKVGK